MNINSLLAPTGALATKVIRAPGPGLAWHLRNRLTWRYISGWLFTIFAKTFSKLTGIPTLTSELRVRVRRKDGRWIDYGVVSRKLITTVGVGFLVDAWQGIVEPEIMRYHGLGEDDTPGEAVGDTALQLELTTDYNPDSTRATGTLAEAAANIFQSVGTNTLDGAAAVVEHGLFSQAAAGGGVLFDRSIFAVINLASGDGLQTTYSCTLTSGG